MPEQLAENVWLYEGDSRDVLQDLADDAADVCISDPPYGAKTHAGARTGGDGEKVLIDFDSITEDEFFAFCKHAVRIAKRWVVMTCEWRHAAAIEVRMPKEFVRLGVWIKPDGAPQFTGDRPGTGWEAVAMLHREGRKRWNGGGHHAVWTNHVERNNEHPTQKPVRLVREWVRLFSDPGEIILDPYAGSGTTGVAAIYEGRGAILIERDAKHADTIRRRIEKVDGRAPGTLTAMLAQGSIFE
jgi:site-specific DNA-methyltransferase (adenine-specific)